MNNEAFVLLLAAFFSVLFVWSFKTLPKEQWQIIASMPIKKSGVGWEGLNFTYYGFFNANSYLLSVVLAFILLGSLGLGLMAIMTIIILIYGSLHTGFQGVGPAHRKEGLYVHRRGAPSSGSCLPPGLSGSLMNFLGLRAGFNIPVVPAMSAMAIAYALGEGTGRIACISFGCCYGKPLRQCSPFWRRLFKRMNFVFSGETKKIAYEANLAGTEVIPVQGITVVLYSAACLAGIYMFLNLWYSVRPAHDDHYHTGMAVFF